MTCDPTKYAEVAVCVDKEAKMAAVDRTSPTGLLVDLPTQVDLGEHVIGSAHRFVLASPRLTPGGTRIGQFVTSLEDQQLLVGDDGQIRAAFSVLAPRSGVQILSSSDSTPLSVTFDPLKRGVSTATLKMIIFWNDGQVERREVKVRAAARALNDLPTPQDSLKTPTADVHAVGAGGTRMTEEQELRLTNTLEQMSASVENVVLMQQQGLEAAARDIESYRRAVDPLIPPILIEFAAIAVGATIGVTLGPIAGGLAAKTVSGIGSKVAKRIAVKTMQGIVKKGQDFAIEKGKQLLTGHSVPAKPSEGAMGDAVPAWSSNPLNAFLSQQQFLIAKSAKEMRKDVVNQKALLHQAIDGEPDELVAHLAQASSEMDAAADGNVPATTQTQQSVVAWISAIARGANGAETLLSRDNKHELEVTKLSGLKAHADGVLEITARLPEDGLDALTVSGATLRGVAQEAADRLFAVPLSAIRVPVAIALLKGHVPLVTIHVDEAKRIRIEGNLEQMKDVFSPVSAGEPSLTSEAQAILYAERVVAKITAKSLQSQGVTEVKSDDADGRRSFASQ